MDDLDLGKTLVGLAPRQLLFNRYTLVRQLGRGGMGVVWLARDGKLERDVALKFLPENVAQDPRAIDDLKRETRRALDLTHPHVVRIYDFVDDDRLAAIAMEYVDGASLSKLALEWPGRICPLERLGPWVRQLCGALDYAHGKAKVVHRDLKPANLMVGTGGDLKIADFGIAASIADTASRASRRDMGSGTLAYMSPQQMLGEMPTVSDDIYSLGATLYDLLTGRPPFHTGNIQLQVNDKVPPGIADRRVELGVVGAAIPPEWESTVAACLAKDPRERPQSTGEVAERLGVGRETAVDPAQGGSALKTGVSGTESPGALRGNGASGSRMATSTAPRKSHGPLYAGLTVAILALVSVGWYFGIHAPGQKRLAEITRLESEARTAAALRLKNERERAAAAKEQADREQRAHAKIVATVDALLDGSTASLRTQTETAVKEYLQSVPERYRTDVEGRWATRSAGWETARLAAARGGIAVRTIPAGAEVRVGAAALEKSPLVLKEQKPGQYPVCIRLDGYEDWQGEVEVKENESAELDVNLVRSTGSLALASEPAGVEVEVRRQGAEVSEQRVRTPAQLKLPTGSYELYFQRRGWPVQARMVEIGRNQTAAVSAEFVPGSLRVESTPAGAEVRMGGKVAGVTPLVLSDMMPGESEVELRLKNYKAETLRGTVAPRQELRLMATLEMDSHFTIEWLGLAMVGLPPGKFAMGSPANGAETEGPVTQVRIRRPFWLGRTEVTQGQWRAVMGNNPSYFQEAGPDAPVEQVSWEEAVAFCRKLTERERAAGRLPGGHVYTLPTEAQWEYACRAGTTGEIGGEVGSVAWYGANSGNTTQPVGRKSANAWGLHDMHGNVWEWCADWYGSYPGGTTTDPTGPVSGRIRVGRGGGWGNTAGGCTSTVRRGNAPEFRRNNLGFRVALSVVPQGVD